MTEPAGLSIGIGVDLGDAMWELRARVSADGFTGEGGGYTDGENVRSFCEAASTYPLARPATLRAGGNHQLALTIRSLDDLGHLLAEIELSTYSYAHGKTLDQLVRVQMSTTYAALETFVAGLRAIAATHQRGEVFLASSVGPGSA